MIHINVTSHTLRITRHASSQWLECNLVIGSEFGPQVIGNEPGEAARLILHVTGHTSHITRQTSHVTRHRSHVTGHRSHITHHTSHITHHTSHITHHTFLFFLLFASFTLDAAVDGAVACESAELPRASARRRSSLRDGTCHTEQRNTLHVTRHTLHVTRHTLHVTCHT